MISRTAPPGGKGGLMDDAYRNMLDMFSTELTKETAENFAELQKTANDFSKIKREKLPEDLRKLVDKAGRKSLDDFADALERMNKKLLLLL